MIKDQIKSIIKNTAKFCLTSGKPIDINVGIGEGHYISEGDCVVNMELLASNIEREMLNIKNVEVSYNNNNFENFIYWKLVEYDRGGKIEQADFINILKEISNYIEERKNVL